MQARALLTKSLKGTTVCMYRAYLSTLKRRLLIEIGCYAVPIKRDCSLLRCNHREASR